jgi:hypothetical protein
VVYLTHKEKDFDRENFPVFIQKPVHRMQNRQYPVFSHGFIRKAGFFSYAGITPESPGRRRRTAIFIVICSLFTSSRWPTWKRMKIPLLFIFLIPSVRNAAATNAGNSSPGTSASVPSALPATQRASVHRRKTGNKKLKCTGSESMGRPAGYIEACDSFFTGLSRLRYQIAAFQFQPERGKYDVVSPSAKDREWYDRIGLISPVGQKDASR